MTTTTSAPPPLEPVAVAPRPGAGGRLLRNPVAVASGVVLIAIVLASVLAPLLAPHDPNAVVAGLARSAPGGEHLMGGDGAGRDVFSRLLYGGRLTLLGALVTALVAMGIGIPAGLVAGYFGGRSDTVAGWVADMLLAIPNLVILLAVIAAIGPQTVPVMAMFGVLIAPTFFRLVRTAVRGVRNELYVDAARISGLTDLRIIRSHILSVVRAPIVIQVSITAGVSVLVQSGLQFLALGDTSVPSWGQMLADAFANIYAAPYLVIWPGVTIGVTVAALALLGGALRDALLDRPAAPPAARAPRRPAPVLEPPPAPAATGLLAVSGLSVAYPRVDGEEHAVVSDVSFGLEPGEVLGLVGESGSGKTQTAFAVLGLLPATARATGSITLDGAALLSDPRAAARARGRRIGYIPQEPMSNLDPSFTIGHQLVEPMRVVLGLSRAAARARALELLESVGIPEPRRTFAAHPHQISGGMAQRVLIAGAVSCNPELLIADEPTTALDVTVQAEVLDVLRGLQRERRMAMLVVTHDFGVVADICDRVAVMQHGRIVEQRDVHSIFAQPEHPYTRMLLGSTLEGASLRAPLETTTSDAATSDAAVPAEGSRA